MKIAVYGVSRSGKDYLLDRSVAYLNTQGISAVHIKGSATLNKLSNQKYGIPLKHADEEKRTVLRKHFIDIVEKTALVHDVVFVDGHYAFMGDDGFYTVFTDADKYCYDHFFYLDTLTEKIIEFSRTNPKTPQDLSIQPDEIDAWKLFEIQGLSKACDALNKELVILDGQTQNCIQFLTQWIKNFSNRFDYPLIAKQLVEQFLENTQIKHQTVVLLDGDNTLAMNDATYDFCDFLNIDKSVLKQIFKGDRYSSYQFFQVQHLYRYLNNTQWEKAIQYAASKIKISDDVWAFSKKQNAYCCILTSGVLQLWQYQADRLGNIEQVWGNSIFDTPNFFVTPMLKKHIALAFQSYGIHVIAIGDSIIDIPMLEVAEQSYIVAHTKLNQVVSQYFSGSLHTKIQQIFVTKWCYPIRQLFEKEDLT